MRRALMAASAIAMLAGAQAFGQTVGVGPAETIIIEPEQRTVIREYVVKERVAPVTVKERISVGATLPADVELRTVPSTWGPKFSKYRYVYSDDRVYLVEPTNRTVVHVVEYTFLLGTLKRCSDKRTAFSIMVIQVRSHALKSFLSRRLARCFSLCLTYQLFR